MELSSELISQFARITNDEPTVNEGSTVYATYRLQGESAYVQIDGSDTITPVATTAGAKSGDRVTVLVKDHKAIVTGNLTDPSANTSTVENLSETVGGLGTLINGASRVATDYIEWKTGTGLIVGNQANKDSSGGIVGSNVLIHAQGVDIRDGSTILAQYTDDYIYLGYNSNTATIDLCNGLATISNQDSGGTYNRLYISGSDGIGIIGGNSVNIGINGATARFVNNAPWESNSPTTPTVDIGVARAVSGSLSVKRVGMTATKDLVILGSVDFMYNTNSGIRVEPITGDTTITGDLVVQGDISGYAKTSDLSKYYSSGDIMVCQSIRPDADGSKACGLSNYRWSNVYCVNAEINTSDRNMKENIEPVSDKYIAMFDLLTPVSYKWIDGDRTHIGFISQHVREKMAEVGLTDMDFGGFCMDVLTDEDGNTTERYGLRYSEFIGIIAAKMKQLESRIEELEGKGVA